MNNLYELYAQRRGEKAARRCAAPCRADTLLRDVLRRLGMQEQIHLSRLWEHWEMVMGPVLARLALPLGHKGEVLLVGGEDPMAMQELQLQQEEILERVNAFLGEQFFLHVHISALLGRRPLNMALSPSHPPSRDEVHPPSGKYLKNMPQDSPVARAYARFSKRKS